MFVSWQLFCASSGHRGGPAREIKTCSSKASHLILSSQKIPAQGHSRCWEMLLNFPSSLSTGRRMQNHSEKPGLKKSPFLHKCQSKSPGRTSVFPQSWRPWSCRVSGSDAQGRKTFLPCPAAEFQVINGNTARTWRQLYVSVQRR